MDQFAQMSRRNEVVKLCYYGSYLIDHVAILRDDVKNSKVEAMACTSDKINIHRCCYGHVGGYIMAE